jgi:hypothetical protein
MILKGEKYQMSLDKVERKFLLKLREIVPEYADLELNQIAHLELKKHLLRIAREGYLNSETLRQ